MSVVVFSACDSYKTRHSQGVAFSFTRTHRAWLAACTILVALWMPYVPTALAHAPIEWSDPKAYSVVPEMPDTVKVRFANEPTSVTMRTIEPEPRSGVTLKPVRISDRTYEVVLPSTVISPTDNKVVIFIETLSTDGHAESGVYLLYVVDPATSTTTSPTTTTVTIPTSVVTTPTAVFVPPATTKSSAVQLWVICVLLASSGSVLVFVVYRFRKRS